MIDFKYYEQYLPPEAPNSLTDLNTNLRIYKDEKVECWYAPMGKFNSNVKVAFYGITPGWNQLKKAYEIKNRSVHRNTESEYHKIPFAGTMRKNLIDMLDQINLNEILKIESSSQLFEYNFASSSSILRYPIFYKGKNYNGHTPNIFNHSFLKKMVDTILLDEIKKLSKCLIIPLGKSSLKVFEYHEKNGNLFSNFILRGFPHPSGAHAKRKFVFESNQDDLKEQINKWKNTS